MNEVSLYFHIPFCRRRCGYCDFNTFAGMNQYIPAYVNALCKEVEIVLSQASSSNIAHTVYFGGGTPSLLTPEDFGQILDSIKRHIEIPANAEVTMEANPETVTEGSICEFSEKGFNRISFGMQSASRRDLHVLDRQHDNQSILNAILWSKRTGFQHINLDLIFGIPGQSLVSWRRTLELALSLGVDHFSVYSLILEDGTRLKRWIDHGLLESPDDDLAADMYELTMGIMEKSGFNQYEISNWARTEGGRSRHNMQYWRYLPYLGFGAGAHGFWEDTRTENVSLIADYIDRVNNPQELQFPAGPAVIQTSHLSPWERIQENMMVSLRLTQEGVSVSDLSQRYNANVLELFSAQISRLTRQGLVELIEDGNQLKLTRKGRLFGNRVFLEFIDNSVPSGFEFLD